jgi:hypothetical protein
MRYSDTDSPPAEADVLGLWKAFSHFGLDAEARLRWLLRFVEQEDLRIPEAAERATLEAMIFSFSARVAPVGPHAPVKMGELRDEVLDPQGVRVATQSVERAQRQVREALTAFAVEGKCELPFKVTGWERLKDGRVVPMVGGDWWSRFHGAVFALVNELGARLSACANPKCHRLFLRSKRQAYCGTRCSQRERTQRFRDRHPDRVSDQRHTTYARKQRARLGKRVKVGRRSRRAKSQDGGR